MSSINEYLEKLDSPDEAERIYAAEGISESEQTAVVYGMPREAAELGVACAVASSHEVAREILKAVRRTRE
jgi:two-component system chemotaxis response regulator CheB